VTPGSAAAPGPGEVRPRTLWPDILLVGLGDLPPRLLAEVGAGVKAALGLGWRPGPGLDRPAYAFNEGRRQYHAPAILRRLAGLRTAPRAPVLGILAADLFLPDDGEYVLSDADRDAGAAVVALGRLGSDLPALRRRAQVEAVHALGHVLGLAACNDGRCAMYPSRDVADADRKGPGLCASCRAALGRT
jgi:archaemetzincin